MEPLPCGIWCFLRVDSVRIELNYRTSKWCSKNCLLMWGNRTHTHIGIGTRTCLERELSRLCRKWASWGCVTVWKKVIKSKVVSGIWNSLRKKIRGYLNFLAAHWWIKPQIWPSQHSFALKIMGCGVLLGTEFFMVPIISYSPLDYLSNPLISHSLPIMHTGMFQR